MPRGPGPDDNVQTGERVRSVPDLGELGARLQGGHGGLVRTGTVLFSTTFTDGRQEVKDALITGVGASVAADPTIAQYGKGSVKLTTGNAIGNTAGILRHQSADLRARLGFNAGFYVNVSDGRLYVESTMRGGGGLGSTFGVRLTWAPAGTITEIALYDNTALYVVWQTRDEQMITGQWHDVKLVVDNTNPSASKYVKLFVDGQVFDISAVTTYMFNPGVRWPVLETLVYAEARLAANQVINIGSLIITTDEP